MAETPERCPTCGTSVPEGAPRCPACGRVFGEVNRCPSCHAVAAVIRRGNITVCAACGKPRAGATVLGGGAARAIMPASVRGRDASTTAMLKRGRARAQRLFGVLALAMGVLMAALVAAVIPGTIGLAMAVVVALAATAVGGLSLRAGARNSQGADEAALRARETAVLELAERRRGALTATDVANEFGVSVEEADATLTRLVGDGTRVGVDVDDEGVVRYVFRELVPAPAQVRVATEEAQALEDLEDEPARREREVEPAAKEP